MKVKWQPLLALTVVGLVGTVLTVITVSWVSERKSSPEYSWTNLIVVYEPYKWSWFGRYPHTSLVAVDPSDERPAVYSDAGKGASGAKGKNDRRNCESGLLCARVRSAEKILTRIKNQDPKCDGPEAPSLSEACYYVQRVRVFKPYSEVVNTFQSFASRVNDAEIDFYWRKRGCSAYVGSLLRELGVKLRPGPDAPAPDDLDLDLFGWDTKLQDAIATG